MLSDFFKLVTYEREVTLSRSSFYIENSIMNKEKINDIILQKLQRLDIPSTLVGGYFYMAKSKKMTYNTIIG